MSPLLWSWLLTIVGALGFYLVGRRLLVGWLVCIFSEMLWILYALDTGQYGFIAGAAIYQWIAILSLWRWTICGKPEKPSRVV